MQWSERNGIRWLEADLPGATAVFSTRSAGSVVDSRVPLASALGLSPERIAIARQVHGAKLAFHQTTPRWEQRELEEADGHVISEPGLAGLVFVADCLPIALAGSGGVAMLHCGWRGLAAGIIARGAEAVGATHAAIGPGIGPCCYEVGDEVLAAFNGLGGGVSSGRMLDLAEVASRLLSDAGVTQVEFAETCTSCEEALFFSHRRDAGRTGRQAGMVWLDGEAA